MVLKPKLQKISSKLSYQEKFWLLTTNNKLQNQARWVALMLGYALLNVESLFLATYAYLNSQTSAYKFSENFVTFGPHHSQILIFFCSQSCLINFIGFVLSLCSLASNHQINMKIFLKIYLLHHFLHILVVGIVSYLIRMCV